MDNTEESFVILYHNNNNGILTKGLKISLNSIGKGFNRFCTESSCTMDIAHNKESATVRNLKSEWWGASLVQEKYQGKGNL
jgi:hypothetical protein